MRELDERDRCHDRLGAVFAEALSGYDTLRRMETLVDHFLPAWSLQGRKVLEVGCGLGFFAERLQQAGAIVTACDIGPRLVEATRRRVGCRCEVVDALALADHFGDERFDVVLSSECIEHTPDPAEAIRQMIRVLSPGGRLSISMPNVVWWPVVRLASITKIRPFDGYENFGTWSELRAILRAEEVRVEQEVGLHLFPFQLRMYGLSRWCDTHSQFLRAIMINICILGRKSEASA